MRDFTEISRNIVYFITTANPVCQNVQQNRSSQRQIPINHMHAAWCIAMT